MKIIFCLLMVLSRVTIAEDSNQLELLYDKTKKARTPYIQPKDESLFDSDFNKEINLTEQDQLNSGTFIGAIPKGTALFNMNQDDRIELTTKEIIVRLFKQKDSVGHQIILNKDGSTTYKVQFTDVTHLTAITQMYETPLTYRPIEEKVVANTMDKNLNIQSDFSFSVGAVSSNYTKDILNESTLNMRTFHYDATTFAKWNFDILLGLLVGFETSSAASSRGFTVSDRTLMVGPIIKTSIFNWGENPVDLVTGLKTSLLSNLEINYTDKSYSYRANKQALKLGLQTFKDTSIFGKVLFGAHLQRTWIKAKSNKYQLDLDRKTFYDDSFLINIGFEKDWI